MTDWINTLQALPEVPGELQGAYLVRCCNALGLVPDTIVEIGVFRGQTTMQVREGFPEAHMYLIDPWEYNPDNQGKIYSRVDSQKKWDMLYQLIVAFWHDDPNTTILRDKSTEVTKYFHDHVDLIFIDGDHSYEAVRQDIQDWLPCMSKPSLFCGHDYTGHGRNKGVKRAVDELLGDEIHIGARKTWVHYIQEGTG